MKSRLFYVVITAIFAFGSVVTQNAEELTIPVETDNQFPPDHSESDRQSENNGNTVVDGPTIESTTLLPQVTNDKNEDSFPDFLCPESCVCNVEKDVNNYIVDCSGNSLTEYPTSIDPKTTILKLHNNELTIIPRHISELKNLKDLDASDNLIKELEIGSVSELPELISLKLANNRFTEYPEELQKSSQLNQLEVLDLGGNVLSTTFSPEMFSNLKALRKLTLSEVTSQFVADLCSVYNETLEMMGTQSCKLFYTSDAPKINKDNSVDVVIPGMISLSVADVKEDMKSVTDVAAPLWNEDISKTPKISTNGQTNTLDSLSITKPQEIPTKTDILETTVATSGSPQPYPAIPGIKGILNIPLNVPDSSLNSETKETPISSSTPEAHEIASTLGTKETRDISRIPYPSETSTHIDVKQISNGVTMPDGPLTIPILNQTPETTVHAELFETQSSPVVILDTPIVPQTFETLSSLISQESSETMSTPDTAEILSKLETRSIPEQSQSPIQATTTRTDTTIVSVASDLTSISAINETPIPSQVPETAEQLLNLEVNHSSGTTSLPKDSQIPSEITGSQETKTASQMVTEKIEIPSSSGVNIIPDTSVVSEKSDSTSSPETTITTETPLAPEAPEISTSPTVNESTVTASVSELSEFTATTVTNVTPAIVIASEAPGTSSNQTNPDIKETPNSSLFSESSDYTISTTEFSLTPKLSEISTSTEISDAPLPTTIPGAQDVTLSSETQESSKTSPVPEAPEITSSLELMTKIPEMLSNVNTTLETSLNKEDTLVVPPLVPEILTEVPEVSQKQHSATTIKVSETPPDLKVPEININSKTETVNLAPNTKSSVTSSVSDRTETFEKPTEPEKISETPHAPKSNESPANDFSLRTAVNNAPDEKVALQNIIAEHPKDTSNNETDVKIGATTVTKASGGVDKSVIAVIVAGMVIIVAVITIKKNWSSIRKRFSSSPRPNDRSGRNANGTTPEEVPLQDKSPV